MKIKWLGHACFKMITDKGTRIITDPFDNTVGYPMPDEEADIVTSSHGHFDHNHKEAIKGDFQYINEPGTFTAADVAIEGIMSFHDQSEGAERGKNIIYTFKADNMTICHAGDLGHVLTAEQVQKIGVVDVLMIPVGGFYTIDAVEAALIVEMLAPKLVIPMHYKTEAIQFPIAGVEAFVEKMGKGEQLGRQEIEVSRELLDKWDRHVVVMGYK